MSNLKYKVKKLEIDREIEQKAWLIQDKAKEQKNYAIGKY